MLFGCVWAVAHTSVCAQYQIQSWTTDDGLPQNTVHSIVQTRDGYLWLATLDGLVRYDGVRFTVFNKNNSKGIQNNRFTRLVVDAHDDLWIGMENSGVIRHHQGVFQTYPFTSNSANLPIWDMTLDNRGELIVFTDRNISRWDGEKFVPYTYVAGETVQSAVLWGRDGTFWYLDDSGLHGFKDNRTMDYLLPATPKPIIRSKRLFEDKSGRIWFGTANVGLFVLENGKLISYTVKDGLPSNHVSPRLEDRQGSLWAVTSEGAAIINDGKVTSLTTKQGLSENALTSIFEDHEGNIWIGTLHRGLNRVSQQSVAFYSTEDGLAAPVVNPIYEDRDGDIWIGGADLTRYHAGRFSRVAGREKVGQAVTAIHQDRTGRMWFGHWGGVYYYENGEFINFTDRLGKETAVADIYEDQAGALWFATRSGLFYHRDGQTTRFTTDEGLASNDVKLIHQSGDGTLWIGTYGGLTRYYLPTRAGESGSFKSFTTADGLASNLVRSLYEDKQGVLWIGSYDGGLTRLKNGRFTRYTTSDGLFNEGVFQILEDDRGWFWMSSNRGVYRVAKQQLHEFAEGKIDRINSIVYNKSDGLAETECNGGLQPAGIKTRDGKLWFPTQRGIAVISPDLIKTNPHAPPVLIESAKIDGEAAPRGESVEIAPGKNNLEIDYTGLSFVKPEFVKFRYKLEGLDKDWVEVGNRRTAYYSYLPPGDYTFRVIAANSDGVWNTQGASVRVRVVPPFYRTWSFGILLLTLIGGAAFLFYRWRVARLERARTAQEEFSRQLLASQEGERKRIAAELHDSLGQNLLIIKNRALLALTPNAPQTVSTEQLNEISATASQALEEVREIARNLRPYKLDRLGLTKALESIITQAAESSEIKFTSEIDSVNGIFSNEDEINLYRIVQESINNILKHSQATEVHLQVMREGHTVHLEIQDNGVGFDAETLMGKDVDRRGFGLASISERARIIGGRHWIRSSPGQGTNITVKIELRDNHHG